MGIAFLVIFVIAALLIFFLFTDTRLEIYAEKSGKDGDFSVWIKYLFIKKCIFKPNDKKDKNNKKSEIENVSKKKPSFGEYKEKIKSVRKIFEIVKGDVRNILVYCTEKLIRISDFDLNIKFGLDDPMETGIINGILYGVVYDILGTVHNYSRIEKCTVGIEPDFNNVCFALRFDCILKMKNAYITVMIFKILCLLRKIKSSK